MVKLKHPETKENAKDLERQARKRGWKVAGGFAVGTGILVAFLMGRCSAEPPMKCPEPDPVKVVPCELEQGAHVDSLCGNGVIDKGVFTVLVRVGGKKGEPATYEFAKIKIDERKKNNPFFCRKDLGKRKKPKPKGYGMSGSSKKTKGKHVAMIRSIGIGAKKGCGGDTKKDAAELISDVIDQILDKASPLRTATNAGENPLKIIVKLKINSEGVASLFSVSATCMKRRCPVKLGKGEFRRITELDLNIPIGPPEEGECIITIPVPIEAQ